MKKILILTGLIALILFFSPRVEADCTAPDASGNCSGGRLTCSAVNDFLVSQTTCCSTQAECSAVSTPPSVPGGTNTGAQTAPSNTSTIDPHGSCGAQAIDTAIGCISTSQTGFFAAFLRIGIGMAGGIAFLLIIYGGIRMMLSAGNPEQLNEAREMVTSAVTGLLLIIFSVFILRIIGVNILGLPGFG